MLFQFKLFKKCCRLTGLTMIVVSVPLAAGSYIIGKQALTQRDNPPPSQPEAIEEGKTPNTLPIPSKKAPFKRPPSESLA